MLSIAEVTERVKADPDSKGIEATVIDYAVSDAEEAVKSYHLGKDVIGYATYLYARHLLFVRVLKRTERFKSVKAENGEYTKFDNANADEAWDEFQRLLKEQKYGRKTVRFY